MSQTSEDDWEAAADDDDWEIAVDSGSVDVDNINLAQQLGQATISSTGTKDEEDNDDDWLTDAPASTPVPATLAKPAAPVDDSPMFIVDFTKLSGGAVHNKFDKHSVNDPDLKRMWTTEAIKALEDDSNQAKMVEQGIFRPCGSSVWRDALIVLRDAHEGHYFGPIFPKN